MLTRDPAYVKSQLFYKGNAIHCKEKAIIEYPVWYEDKELAKNKETVSFYGIAAIIVGDKYSVVLIPTMLVSSPIAVGEVERNGEKYRQLLFGKGDCIINSKTVVQYPLLSYTLFENFYMRTKEPWFVEYEDLVKIMDNLVPFAGSNVGDNFIANELITSFITRSAEDKKKFYREVGGKGKYVYVDLMNVYHSAIGTVNKLAGNYFSNAVTSAIVQKNKGETKLERHLRN